MKKLVITVIVICLAFAAVLGVAQSPSAEPATPAPAATNTPTAAPAPEATAAPAAPAAEPAPTPEPEEIIVPYLDYDKLYAAYAPENVVLKIDDEEIDWDEYYSWLYMSASQIEDYFAGMAMYGVGMSWENMASDEYNFAQYVPMSVEHSIAQLVAIEKAAEMRGYVKDEVFAAELAEQKHGDMVTLCGGEVSEEEFYAVLAENRTSRSTYERMAMANAVYSAAFIDLYGEKLEKINDDDVYALLDEHDFMNAAHILILTGDPTTGETYDEQTKAEKKALADSLYEELASIDDREARVLRFGELKDEYCEDSGKVMYPDGYVFTPGTMVPEFESTCEGLAEYAIAPPVETSYGYHIIMRLPLTPDTFIDYNSDGTQYNGRILYADEDYTKGIDVAYNSLNMMYAPGFVIPDLTEFIK